ncbi:G-protein coupled receptor [Desmophyllum pertusum]|uniref:G-protein coupled receptor n=1 Tax=Desmophyllum pertusum TaxID=174260 RepID=A0A9W9ZI11_9CNID|nr:G-protein coupled receptor [Desmophyllum pertusum]
MADPQANKVLSSGIISSTILFNNGSKFEHLSEPVVINLSALKVNGSGSRTCVFLDDNESWSQSGCVVHKLSPSHTECHCYHMTSFAVLMDVHGAYEGDAIAEDHEVALTIVSIVGCLIAFICYVTLLFAFYFLRRRTETLYIHMNLVAAQSLAIFFFLVAYPGVRIKDVCFALAVLLHYFQLASFCWMLVEGINLLRGMVKVFRVTSRLRTYSLFAWGIPALVVALTASISRHEYLRDNFCWISHRVIWSFAGPVALVLLINLTVLVVAIKIVVKRTHYKQTNTMSTALELEIRAAFKTLVILVPLLGVTWLLGFISIHNNSLVFQYLFAIINSMQGLYFLIAQYCFDDDIKSNAHRASNRMKRLFSLSTSKSTSSWSGTSESSGKKSVDSHQQNPAEQHNQHNEKDSKDSSPDEDYSDRYLQNNLNAIASQLQRTETDYPGNDKANPAMEANVPKQHINETRF